MAQKKLNFNQGQPTILFLRSGQIDYRSIWLRLRRGAFICVGWEVRDPIRQMTLRCSKMRFL